MSEHEVSAAYEDLSAAPNEAVNGLIAGRPATEREGLPRGFRMRADSHYVDQLESRHDAPPVRLLNVRHLRGADSASVPPKLVESIATHGVLQPLLVRRKHGQYLVIAGANRLAAAIAAGLTDVPCVIHEVEDVQAAALAAAANVCTAPSDEARPAGLDQLQIVRALASDLAAIDASAAVLTRSGGGLTHRITADLIQAQAARAAWTAQAALVLANLHPGSRPASIEAILDRVKSLFDAHARLRSVHLESAVSRTPAPVLLDQELGTLAIAGCVFATLTWLDEFTEPRVEVRADAPTPRTLRVEVVQRLAPVDDEAVRFLRESVPPRTRNLTMALGLLTARCVAARYAGNVELTPIATRGSVIRSTFTRPEDH